MNGSILGKSVQGASHIRNDRECQDSNKFIEMSDGTIILAVADGHGSDSCPYSKTGAQIAVNTFCSIMQALCEQYKACPDILMRLLNREGDVKIAQKIDLEWKRRVYKQHGRMKRKMPEKAQGEVDKKGLYKLYGTTLLGLVISANFVFAFQLGDGDINYVDSKGCQRVVEAEKILGVETHSLAKDNSWKKVITRVFEKEKGSSLPYMYMLTTDGMANSFASESEFQKTEIEYYQVLVEYGPQIVENNLEKWLSETSEMGCGDDITALIAFAE